MIIQFSHPGKELEIKSGNKQDGKAYKFSTEYSGFRFWNNDGHKRKFMCHEGWYLENMGNSFNPIPQKGEFYFWGEWEAQSEFLLTGNQFSTQPSIPHAVHKPIFSNRGKGVKNSDPFVFGEHFYYTNCKQSKEKAGKILLNLPAKSIILFGSERNKTDFVIDTVFVVNSKETVADYKKQPTLYPQMLRDVTLDLNEGLEDRHFLYKGMMYDFCTEKPRNEADIFSFIPCKIDCGITGFERPVINWEKFGLKKPGSYQVLKEIDFCINFSPKYEFWKLLVDDLLQQGFSLGLKLEMPVSNDVYDFPVNVVMKINC